MALFDFLKRKSVDEEIEAFKKLSDKTKDKNEDDKAGETIDDIAMIAGFGSNEFGTFDIFYNQYINQSWNNELMRINAYREMAAFPEIAEVIENATDEATQEDDDGNILTLDILDSDISSNDTISKKLYNEFETLFYNKIEIQNHIWNLFKSYMIDGRVYYEKIIDIKNPKEGIIGIKKIPAETVDYDYDIKSGKIIRFYQYFSTNINRPNSLEKAEEMQKDKKLVILDPLQIGFINTGNFGRSKKEIIGYLEKAKIPYNQLKLLESSVIIYRLIRAPERFVFRIDTGNMPMDKAMKFLEKVKTSFKKKIAYDPSTGKLTGEPEIFCIRKNTEIPLLDGRYLTLEEIINEHNEGKENWVYSINKDTHEIEPGKIINAAITRKNEKLIRVYLDDNSYFDTTLDHKFILRDGSEIEAINLKSGDSLMPCYTKLNEKHPLKGYECCQCPKTGKWINTHTLVSKKINGIQEKGYAIHHIDFNIINNTPNNLKLMTKSEHSSYHIKEKWGKNYSLMYDAVLRGSETKENNPEYVAARSKWVTKTNIEQNKVEKMRKVLNTPEVRKRQKNAVSKHKKEWFENEENTKNFSNKKKLDYDNFIKEKFINHFVKLNKPNIETILNSLNTDTELIDYFRKLNTNENKSVSTFNPNDKFKPQHIKKLAVELGYKGYKDFRYNYKHNHKVLKTEILNETDDTGCITVEGNHNFAVSFNKQKKVFILNSILENFWLPVNSDGRGSSVETVGGQGTAGFTELDDIRYFQKKLYQALRYPPSRISLEAQENGALFGGTGMGEITRDEIKWSKFLQRQQTVFCNSFRDLFLLHLELKGLKDKYGLDQSNLRVYMQEPSLFQEQMRQRFLETRMGNYTSLADREEFSKYFLMKKYLEFTDEDIQENSELMIKDLELGLVNADELKGDVAEEAKNRQKQLGRSEDAVEGEPDFDEPVPGGMDTEPAGGPGEEPPAGEPAEEPEIK